MAEQSGTLSNNILYFARALRAAGLPVGPGAVLDALAAVQAAGVGTRDDFYWTLHAVFVKRHEHSILFDQAFRMFFRKRAYLDKLMATMLPEAAPDAPKPPPPGAQRIQEALFAGAQDKERETAEAEVDRRDARIAVKFAAEVVQATRDRDGNLIEGNADQVQTIADEWTFARNPKSRDPNWKLVATNQLS